MSERGYRFIDAPQPRDGLVAYELSGHFSAEDMRTLLEHIETVAAEHGKLRLFQDVTGYEGTELAAIGEKLKHLKKLWRAIERVAVVGDKRWMEIWVGIVDPITPQEIKHFGPDEKDAAFAWLAE